MATAPENYISGNYKGSLLTMNSQGAIIWGIILKFGNLALVVMVSTTFTFRSNALFIDTRLTTGYCILAEIIRY